MKFKGLITDTVVTQICEKEYLMGKALEIKLILSVIFITTGSAWFADVIKQCLLQYSFFDMSVIYFILFFGGLILVIIGLYLAKSYADKLCKPNQLSFKEISKSQKDKLLLKTNLIVCGISTITEKTDSNGKTEVKNVEVDKLKDRIKSFFEKNSAENLCNDLKELDSDLPTFSWQQQIRLFKEMSRYSKNFTVSVIASKESFEQLPAFELLISEFNAKFKTNIKLVLPENAIDFTQVNEVHKSIEKIIKDWQEESPNSYRMIDVTAGQKTASMSGVLASVANNQNYTVYVDTQKPYPIRIQNIENEKQSELKVI